MAGTLRLAAAVKALSLTLFNSQRFRKLSSWQRSILAARQKNMRGNFSCFRHLSIPGSFLLMLSDFFFSAVFSSPTFKIKNHIFFGRTCYKNTLSERSKFIFFHEQSGIFQYFFHVFCCSCFSKETYNTPIGRTPLAIPPQRQLFQGIPKHIACWLKGFFRGVVSSSVC